MTMKEFMELLYNDEIKSAIQSHADSFDCADGAHLLVKEFENLYVWDIRRNELAKVFSLHSAPITTFATSPASRMVISCSQYSCLLNTHLSYV